MDRKLERDAARFPNSILYSLSELDMVAITRCQIVAGLRNADDRLSRLEFLSGDPVVVEALQINRSLSWFGQVVEPDLAAQTPVVLLAHEFLMITL
jgi:hypothetical protein